jgi:hypothetical protein
MRGCSVLLLECCISSPAAQALSVPEYLQTPLFPVLLRCLLQSKLQKAAMMVWELLAPVNGKFLPIDVVPGGSVRLTVQQPGNASAAAATKTATQQKKVGACFVWKYMPCVWSAG